MRHGSMRWVFIRLHVLCVWLEVLLRYAVWETVRAHFQRGTGFRSMQPPLLVRALREHCALLSAPAGARAMGYVKGTLSP